jgi:hypothetical protein
MFKGIMMKNKYTAVLIMLFTLVFSPAYAKVDRWYKVEVLVFEMKDKNTPADEWSTDPGKPNLVDAVTLSSDPNAEFGVLADNNMMLLDAKKRIQKSYHLVLHKGWRQQITDKDHAQKVHLVGGKDLLAGEFEVDGTVRLSAGRNLNVDADLLFRKPVDQTKFQAFRLKESSRLRVDEISYIDHPHYGMIIMVTPEKSPTAANGVNAKKVG